MRKHLMVVALFGVLGGLILVGRSWSQAQPQPANAPGGSFGRGFSGAAGASGGNAFAPSAGFAPFGGAQVFGDFRDSSARSEVGQLMNQLREADDDAKKAELTKQLDAAVAKYFDEDMEARETELTKLEERLNKLRAQLDRRRKAKAEIIQLQIKVMVNEAEGLGFSGASFFEPGSFPSGFGMGAAGGRMNGSMGAGIAAPSPNRTTPATPKATPAKK